ncbi:MAG: KEOPS complex kinase/ATPase Bud32 [Promethearchaeota archaeon]
MIKQDKILAKGAEAIIYRGSFLQTPIVLKHRLPKIYRLPQIDNAIRLQRLRAEARIMVSAWKIGARVPVLLGIDFGNRTLLIEEIQGEILFFLMNTAPLIELKSIFKAIGQQVGLLHKNDITHGDLTVFNIVINKHNEPWLIDFGLSHVSMEIEKKADDLLTFYSTLKAISSDFQNLFDLFKLGYIEISKKGRKTFEHMKKIQSRARYIARENRLE